MEPEDRGSPEAVAAEEENGKAASERKEDGEEARKTGKLPVSRIPTFQSSVGRKRVTVQTAESSAKTDGSSQQSHKERAGFIEAGRAKLTESGGRETALPITHLHTDHSDAHSEIDQSLDQTNEIRNDSNHVEMCLQRPPLRNICENSDDAICEFQTVTGGTFSDAESKLNAHAVVEQRSSCSLPHQACEGSLRRCSRSSQPEENSEDPCIVPDKSEAHTDKDEAEDKLEPLESKQCFKETQANTNKTLDTSRPEHTKTKGSIHSKKKGKSFACFCLLPSILLLFAGFALNVWQYGVPRSMTHLMLQLELHWLESFWMPEDICTSDCRLTLVESIPEGLSFPSGSPQLPSISETWTDLLSKANSSVHIAAFYFTLRDSDMGLTEPSSILSIQPPQAAGTKRRAEVRGVDLQSITGGILHTKLWVVDKKHMYLGSANMDWRSLSQVKEVGVAVEDCSCLAHDALRIFGVYWEIGAQKNGSLPPFWPARFSALSSSEYPLDVKFNGVPARVYLSSSPPPLSSFGRSDDLSTILSVISDAQLFVYVSVMDYLPLSQFTDPIRFWPAIDSALREAACTRGVEVKLLVSCWSHSSGAMFVFLQSLAVLNKPPLSCHIQIRVFEVPSTQEQQRIPFARVNHAKYMVTDRVVYIGTSNWSENYFTQTAGVGLVVNQTGSSMAPGHQTAQSQLQNIFQRDWGSEYAQKLSDVHAEHCSGKTLT
ncbi:hypothetical protein DNTS_006272 [Danionella cerebrum]|uniref:PLD phosphodiesterase domain-containing protein n=1 Tax=Danionella cerebrum TaxID=2873325 RepID=A0A553QFI1_9TELE|nr:hypothetical protein DNTS_006272 [Danionella translucida]